MSSLLEDPALAPPANPLHRWRWFALSGIIAANLVDLLDTTIINIAAPAIRTDLGGSYASLQWIIAGYTVALAVLLLTGGRLGDMYGRRRVMLIGVAGFGLTSLACALAQSPGQLIAGRVLLGGFGALMMPQLLGLLRDLFDAKEQQKAFAAFGPVMGLGALLGPLLGGVLISTDLFGTGWRLIFLINTPVCLYAFAVCWRMLPASAPTHRSSRLDLFGAVLAGIGAFLLIYPLVEGRELGWPVWSLVMLGASLPVLGAFGVHEVRRKRSGRTPLIEPGLFAKRPFRSGIIFAIFFFASLGGLMLTLGVLLQAGLGFTPLHASLTMAPWSIGTFAAFGIAMSLADKLGRKVIQLGMILIGVGLGALYLTFQLKGSAVGHWNLVLPQLLCGLGMGMVFAMLFDTVLGGVEDHEVGTSSSVLESIQQLGSSLGVAALGTLFFALMGSQVHANYDGDVSSKLRTELTAASVTGPAQDQLVAGLRLCLHDREAQTDPDTVPASCRPDARPENAAVSAALSAAATETHKRGAVDAAKQTSLATLGLVLVGFLLSFGLPRKARKSDH